MEGKRSWWHGSWWGSMFNRIRKQVSSWEEEEREMKWKGGAFTDQASVRWDQTLGVSAVRDGEFTKEPLCSLSDFPWQSLKTVVWLSIVSWGKEVLYNSTPSLWELFWEDSVLSLLGMGSIPGWRTKIRRAKKKKKKKDLFFSLEIQKEGGKEGPVNRKQLIYMKNIMSNSLFVK